MRDLQDHQVLLGPQALLEAAFTPKEIRGQVAIRGHKARRDFQALRGPQDLPVPNTAPDEKVTKVTMAEWASREPKVHAVYPVPPEGRGTKAQLDIGASKEPSVISCLEIQSPPPLDRQDHLEHQGHQAFLAVPVLLELQEGKEIKVLLGPVVFPGTRVLLAVPAHLVIKEMLVSRDSLDHKASPVLQVTRVSPAAGSHPGLVSWW